MIPRDRWSTIHNARYTFKLKRMLACMGYDLEVVDAKLGGTDEPVNDRNGVRLVETKDLV